MVQLERHRRVRGQVRPARSRTSSPDAPSRFIHVSAFDDGLVLVLNPADDDAFVGLAKRLTTDLVVDPADLQATLRERYPAAVVRRRDIADERVEVWYVYRDGRWIGRSARTAIAGG